MANLNRRGLVVVLLVLAGLGTSTVRAVSPTWPTVEQQLAADKVQPGSALEALVRLNQETALLDPAEVTDGLPYPVWLRVLWRKTHDVPAAPPDPATRYPQTLAAMHAWLVGHQNEAGRVLTVFDAYGIWPNLAQQLSRHHIGTDTALARLVDANQELWMLRREEVSDLRPEPPWLRVIYRKGHPDVTFSGADPTGGYPLVLKEVLEWYETHQDLRSDPAVAEGQGGVPAAVRGEGGKSGEVTPNGAVVDPDQKISGSSGERRSESDIRVNYVNPQKIVSASNNISGSWQGQYWSNDGGQTWHQTLLPAQGGDSFHSDPTVDWSSDGTTAWSTTMGIAGSMRIKAYKSTDGGSSWVYDGTVSGSQTSTDKQMVWLDHAATSPYKDQIYAIWHNGSPGYVGRRTSAGWQTPLQISSSETTGTAIGSDIKTNANGDVFAFWPDTGSRGLYVRKSTDGGATFAPYVRIATTWDSYDIGVPSFNNRRALIYVAGGAYRTATKNLVYATWTDLTGTTDCNTESEEPGSNVSSTCKTRVWFSRSTDGGATWSAGAMINNQATLNDQFNQWLAVDESTGALGVIYYDTVGDSGRKKTDIYYQGSFDDGLTWSAAVKVTTAMTDETTGNEDSGNQYGDYNGLSGYAGTFFPSWTDRRVVATGVEEIWTAKITDQACTRPGAPAIGSVTVGGDNKLLVSWSQGTPAAASFKVWRADGSCDSHGGWTMIASGVTTTSYTDATVQGGLSYAYKVGAVDSTGFCESELASGCASGVASGPCTAPPPFVGAGTVANQALPTCTLDVGWSAATPLCSGPVTYNVYRSSVSPFTPGPANRVASGLTSTSYTDWDGLVSGTSYTYVVRAVDTSNGAEDTNLAFRSGAPTGPIAIATWTDDAGDTGAAAMTPSSPWVVAATGGHTAPHAYTTQAQKSACGAITSPTLALGTGAQLSFWSNYFLGADYGDKGQVEVSEDGGSTWQRVPMTYPKTSNSSGDACALPSGQKYFAGINTTWAKYTANLGTWAGKTVRLRLRLSTDSTSTGELWTVDDIEVTNVQTPGVCTSGAMAMSARSVVVDNASLAPGSSDQNGVLEPGEQVRVVPTWHNGTGVPQAPTGIATGLGGPAGAVYSLLDASASYESIASTADGSCSADPYGIGLSQPTTRPANHWDATFTETLSTGTARTWTLHVGDSFADVARSHWAYRFIETIFHNRVTAGCSADPFGYCPGATLTRAEMAVLLLMAKHGPEWVPPLSTGTVFTDVPVDHWAGDFIEELAAEGITSGCGPGLYCPGNPITRAEMAVFLLMAEHGTGYVPPLSTGTVFTDVPMDHWAGDFIEELAAEGITSGCAPSMYCPDGIVTRAEMAVFLTVTFDLKLNE